MKWLDKRREQRERALFEREQERVAREEWQQDRARWWEKNYELRKTELELDMLKAKNRARELDQREAKLRLEREKMQSP